MKQYHVEMTVWAGSTITVEVLAPSEEAAKELAEAGVKDMGFADVFDGIQVQDLVATEVPAEAESNAE